MSGWQLGCLCVRIDELFLLSCTGWVTSVSTPIDKVAHLAFKYLEDLLARTGLLSVEIAPPLKHKVYNVKTKIEAPAQHMAL